MKTRIKCSPLLLAFCLIAASLICGVPAAKAADSDFDVSFKLTPNPVGPLGADMDLKLTIENTGATDITWVRVDFSTDTPYSKKWTASPPIHPGDTRAVHFAVPFTSHDINVARGFSVSMNNDGDPMPDGDKSFSYNIHSREPFTFDSTVTPAGPYHPGNTITVTMEYRNSMAEDSATGVVTDAYLEKDGRVLNNLPAVSQGFIAPGKHKHLTFTYTLEADDVGRVRIHYILRATMMGREYDIAASEDSIDVTALALPTMLIVPPSSEPEPPEVKFTAVLSADPMEIDAGDTVDFRVKIDNTGDDNIGGFEITDMGGAAEANAEGVHAGHDRSVTISREISESCDVRFVVIGRTGDLSVSKQTNSVHITVREAPETASPSVSGGETASPPVSAEQSAAASASAEAPNESEIAAETAQPAAETVKPASSEVGAPDILYVLIIIFALIIIAGAVVIAVIAARRKKQ